MLCITDKACIGSMLLSALEFLSACSYEVGWSNKLHQQSLEGKILSRVHMGSATARPQLEQGKISPSQGR